MPKLLERLKGGQIQRRERHRETEREREPPSCVDCAPNTRPMQRNGGECEGRGMMEEDAAQEVKHFHDNERPWMKPESQSIRINQKNWRRRRRSSSSSSSSSCSSSSSSRSSSLVWPYDLPPFFPCFIVPNAPGMVWPYDLPGLTLWSTWFDLMIYLPQKTCRNKKKR